MKTFAALVLFVACVLCTSTMSVHATSMRDTTDLTCATPSDYRFLWYGQLVNEFDSARIRYIVGEFRMWDSLDAAVRLPIRMSEDEWQTEATILYTPIQYHGTDGGRGADSALIGVLRTEPAVARQGGRITFSTLASIEQKANCIEGTYAPIDTTAYLPHNYRDAQLALQNANAILDTTSFVVQLVNLTDGTRITLDSMCIMPNANKMMPNTGTTDVSTVNKSVNVPSDCWGDSVYLQIVPSRWGPTQYGMSASKVRYPTSVSTMYKNLPTTYDTLPRFLDTTFMDSVHRWEYEDLAAYLGADTNRNCLPIVFGGLTISDEYGDDLDSVLTLLGKSTTTYCDCLSEWKADSAIVGATLYPPVSFEKRGLIGTSSNSRIDDRAEHYFRLASYDSESSVRFDITSDIGVCTVSLYDLTGRRLATLWEGPTPYIGNAVLPPGSSGLRIITLACPQLHTTSAVKVMVR